MYTIQAEAAFDSAHFLYGYDGKCSNLHGHRWRIIGTFCSASLSEDKQTRGMVMDFGDVKAALKKMADDLDHKLIYEAGSLKDKTVEALKEEGFEMVVVGFRPTAENFAKFFFDELKKQGLPVIKTEVYETPNNCASYQED